MKKFLNISAVLLVAVLSAGCFSNKKTETEAQEPYNRSAQRTYDNQMRYAVFAPFMYENSFYSHYSLAKKIDGPDRKGYYVAEFTNGPKKGQTIKTKNIILKTRRAEASDLKKGMVVLVNHWDPRVHNENTPVDTWRKGVVYNLEKAKEGLVMLEFPYDSNDFMATKETYGLNNILIILSPAQRDPRIFL